MIDFLNSFKSLLKLERIHIDNNTFKLHYKVSTIMLLAFSILLTSKQYFGDPIDCDVEERKEVIDTYCWIFGTFIVKETLGDEHVPGLGATLLEDSTAIARQIYYQWVCITFCAQALFFYLPRYLWKTWEGGRLRLLVKDINMPIVTTINWDNGKKEKLVKYLLTGNFTHNIYTIRYSVCEILNFLNVIGQIYFLDWFINGRFLIYGIAYATYDMVNPMDSAFPKITKCTYKKYGPSGQIQIRDALCVLPLNVLNEKFFLVLWYWFLFLLIVSFFSLIYRGLFLFIPKFRVYLLRAQTRNIDKKRAKYIIDHITYGNFFLLYKVGKNVNPILYRELVLGIYDFLINKNSYKNYVKNIDDV